MIILVFKYKEFIPIIYALFKYARGEEFVKKKYLFSISGECIGEISKKLYFSRKVSRYSYTFPLFVYLFFRLSIFSSSFSKFSRTCSSVSLDREKFFM